MGIPQKEVPKHWNYFLMLEEDLENTARFVEFHTDNYSTYSLELSRLLVAACGEVDTVLKQFCKRLNPEMKKKPNIEDYRRTIAHHYPGFSSLTVNIPRYGLAIEPWINWGNPNPKNPNWWKGHNGIKHNRNSEFKEGNLKNVLNAMGGLYIALVCFYTGEQEEDLLVPMPSLYFPKSFYAGETFSNGQFHYNFSLAD